MQPFKIVIGYLPGIDRLPSDLLTLGLVHRFAFVLETFRSDSADIYFDSSLYGKLVNIISNVAPSNSIRVVPERKEPAREVHNAEEICELFNEIPRVRQKPFYRLLFMNDSLVVAVLESEPWAQVGGPLPYHDSYTLSLFTASDLSQELVKAARVFVEQAGVELSEVIQGNSTPVNPGVIDKLKAVLGIRWRPTRRR
jgi:hypothetical protein